MSVNDRLYDELLAPLVEHYYGNLRTLAGLPRVQANQVTRAWYMGRLDALEVEGDHIADVLEVARPDWAAMRDLAVVS